MGVYIVSLERHFLCGLVPREITVRSPLSDATHLSGPGSSVHEAGHVTLAAAAMPVPRPMLPCRFALAVSTVELTSVSFADHDWH